MEQPLTFSDRRAAVAVVAGLVALALVGIVGGALFDDPCAELVTVGGRQTFVRGDPTAVLGAGADGQDLEALVDFGQRSGLGPWRGAVAVAEVTEVVGAGDGFLVFGPDGIDALEPGLSAVNANRSHTGRRAFRAFRGAAVGAAGDVPYEVAVFDEDLALIGCGEIVTPDDVLAVDRVRALHAEGRTLRAVGLDGDPDWSRAFDAPVGHAELLLGAALVTTTADVHLVALDTGRSVHRWPVAGRGGPATVRDVEGARALVETAGGLVLLDLRDGGLTTVPHDPGGGAALLAGAPVAGADLPPLPGELRLAGLRTSDATYTAILAQTRDQRWVLLYGPAAQDRD